MQIFKNSQVNDEDLKILFAISRPPHFKRKKILDNISGSLETFQSVYLNKKEEIKDKENTIILNESSFKLYLLSAIDGSAWM